MKKAAKGTALFLALSLIISSLIYGRANLFGYRAFYILSDSMEPTIMTGNIVLGKVTDKEDLSVGDVAAYRYDSKMPVVIIHRIFKQTKDGFIFKGDNNPYPDEAVVPEDKVLYKIISY